MDSEEVAGFGREEKVEEEGKDERVQKNVGTVSLGSLDKSIIVDYSVNRVGIWNLYNAYDILIAIYSQSTYPRCIVSVDMSIYIECI